MNTEYEFRCHACKGMFYGDRRQGQDFCHNCTQELLPAALAALKLAKIVIDVDGANDFKEWKQASDAVDTVIAKASGMK